VGDAHDPPSAVVLRSEISSRQKMPAYQARSGTGSVDKIDEHHSAGEGNILGIGRIVK
jgi:hypothetical protein